MVSIKKTEKTKAKLLKTVRFIISKGDKASVTSITKKANLAYGTFYRYFKDLDEIYLEAIEASLADLSEELTQDLANVNPAPLRVYLTWYLVIDSFKDKHTASWLLEHPGIINKAFFDAAPMSEAWIQESIKDSKLPSFTKKNADHYLKVRAYIFWMFPNCLSQLIEGKQTVDVFTELMNASNVFNFSNSTHQLYIRKSIKYFEKKLIQ
ncbi:TetR/AcrR family transcriptional regulator [Gammaproteobacteria bacterium]|nr:TetR/AcrR family transcriptional regulator [Gammaproteobacteria bacterium]